MTQPTPAAIRQRRYRERVRTGAVHVRFDVPAEVIDALVDGGYLAEWDSEKPERVARALIRIAAGTRG